jgi:alkylation response protein AidB-like acyl-CoA dehydrogenase
MAHHARDVAKEQRWRDRLAEQAASTLSVRAFCRERQLGEAAFYAWRKTIRARDGQVTPTPAKPAPAFVPVTVVAEPPRHAQVADLVLELAGGHRVRIPEAISAARLADLSCALEARGAS